MSGLFDANVAVNQNRNNASKRKASRGGATVSGRNNKVRITYQQGATAGVLRAASKDVVESSRAAAGAQTSQGQAVVVGLVLVGLAALFLKFGGKK